MADNAEARRRIIQNAQEQMSAYIANQTATGFAQAVQEAGPELSKLIKFIGEALGAEAIPKELIALTHQTVANQVGRSIVQAYTHRRNKRFLPSYRQNDQYRFAGNKMLRALQNPANYVGNAQGIFLLDRTVLDTQAKQWYRLNFGAGGAGAGSNNPQEFPLTWSGMLLFSIGFTGKTSSGFILPPGVFIGEDGTRAKRGSSAPGTNPFYFAGGSPPPGGFGRGSFGKRRPTRGIEANNFLDAGARRLVEELPRAYIGMYEQLVRSKGLGGVQKKVVVRAPLARRAQRVGRGFI